MDNFIVYRSQKEYTTRGCNVKIDAVSDPNRVTVEVKNINTGLGSSYIHVLLPGRNEKGYSDEDIREIKTELNNLLDSYGDSECNEIYFTNQILS